MAQLATDDHHLHDVLCDSLASMLLQDPNRSARVRQEIRDIHYDTDLLGQRARRVLARM